MFLSINTISAASRRILTNGNIITGIKERVAEAVVIEGDKIIFVGTAENAKKYIIPQKTIVSDLKGMSVIPGFHDGDMNFLLGAGLLENKLNFFQLDLETIIHRLKNEKIIEGKNVVFGYNFEHLVFESGKWPNRYDLDKVSVDSPVVVFSSDGNTAWVNSYTLKQFGLDKRRLPVQGGKILRFEDNKPSGILIGKAIELLEDYNFKAAFKKIRPGKKKILESIIFANQFGLTSVTTFGDLYLVKQLEELESKNKLNLRFNIILPSKNIGRYLIKKVEFSSGSPLIRVISVTKKIDGNLYSSTAAMFSKYESTGGYGFLTTNVNDISDLVNLYRNNSITTSFNAEGDRGVHMIINGIRSAVRKLLNRNIRYRISNFHFVTEEDIARLKELNIIPVMRPGLFIRKAALIEKLVGQRKSSHALKGNTLQNSGVTIAFGSGWPEGSLDPLRGIGFAVFRRIKTGGKKENTWFLEEKITFADAMHAYTYAPAYSISTETELGTIEKGKFADLVILEGNIFDNKLDFNSFNSSIKLHETIFSGRSVYKKGETGLTFKNE